MACLPLMWASLNCGRPAHAVWRTSGFKGWSWIWIVYNIRFLGQGFQSFPTGSPFELILVLVFGSAWLVIRLLKFFFIDRSPHSYDLKWDPQAMVFRQRRPSLERTVRDCEGRLIREFREIVREPLPDPSDPRFKSWNVSERFPWGWGIVQQQLHERLVRTSGKPPP